MNPASRTPSDPWPRLFAWAAVIGSTLPDIVWRESGHEISFWFTMVETLLILAAGLAAVWVPRLRGLARFLIAIALLNFVWDYLSPALAGLNSVRAVTDNASWGARLFLSRTFTLSGVVLVGLTLIGSGVTRRDLFLCWGNPAAPAQPIRFSACASRCRGTGLAPPSFSFSPWRWRLIST